MRYFFFSQSYSAWKISDEYVLLLFLLRTYSGVERSFNHTIFTEDPDLSTEDVSMYWVVSVELFGIGVHCATAMVLVPAKTRNAIDRRIERSSGTALFIRYWNAH